MSFCHIYQKPISLLITAALAILMVAGCESAPSEAPRSDLIEPEAQILAKVADRVITVDEFIRRAEYTIRPPYCDSNTPFHKKIILNSLIAEKLFAIEAGGDNLFISSEQAKNYLQGRQEQAMRKWQYYQQAHQKVELDTQKLARVVHYMGRKYEVQYVNIDTEEKALEFQARLDTDERGFEEILKTDYGLSEIPKRDIEWNSLETGPILDTFFTEPLKKGQVLGPLQTDNGHYLFVQVKGWKNTPAITNQQIAERVDNVAKHYTGKAATNLYDDYVREVMRGKQLRFDRQTFFALANILGPIYLKSWQQKEELLEGGIWHGHERGDDINWDTMRPRLETLYPQTLFTISGEAWTVEDLLAEMRVHPLVFRETQIKNEDFGEQLQYAIMDLIRDRFLTEKAYEAGYDKLGIVTRNLDMWRDSMNSLNHKATLLARAEADSLYEESFLKAITEVLDPLVDSLQTKYSDQIIIDTDAFNSITLTRTAMVATDTNVPYKTVVPLFPLLTTDHWLDYGRKMEKTE